MRRFTIIFFVLAAMAVTAPAFAGSSSSDAYSGKGDVANEVIGGGGNTAPVTPTQESSGSLPFTGFDLALLASGGLLLVGIGVTMRRIARPRLDA